VTVSTRQGVNARGQEYFSSYAAKVDGKEYPRQVKGANAASIGGGRSASRFIERR
jgi:hypothetical protein